MNELLVNPQAFLDLAISAIRICLRDLMVKGIKYHELTGKRYDMSLCEEEVETYLSSVYPSARGDHAVPLEKTLMQAQAISQDKEPVGEPFACVVAQSNPERTFARLCATEGSNVRFFFKLPSKFKIPTPLGTYNPDWAVVMEGDTRVYFVAETKSTTIEAERRPAENFQIKCGMKHFELASDVVFKVVTLPGELVAG